VLARMNAGAELRAELDRTGKWVRKDLGHLIDSAANNYTPLRR
jgi:hypothetical protein